MDVAGQGHAHEIGHHAARGQQAERRRSVADEVAQPADDLLLHERRERAGVPDVDALVGHLGEQLAHHRHRQRRRREVAELARMLRVHLARPPAGPGTPRGRPPTAMGRRAPRPGPARAVVERASRGVVARRRAHRPVQRVVVQEVERGGPGVGPEPLEGRARCAGIAIADQLRLGVPGEAGQVGRRDRPAPSVGGGGPSRIVDLGDFALIGHRPGW